MRRSFAREIFTGHHFSLEDGGTITVVETCIPLDRTRECWVRLNPVGNDQPGMVFERQLQNRVSRTGGGYVFFADLTLYVLPGIIWEINLISRLSPSPDMPAYGLISISGMEN